MAGTIAPAGPWQICKILQCGTITTCISLNRQNIVLVEADAPDASDASSVLSSHIQPPPRRPSVVCPVISVSAVPIFHGRKPRRCALLASWYRWCLLPTDLSLTSAVNLRSEQRESMQRMVDSCLSKVSRNVQVTLNNTLVTNDSVIKVAQLFIVRRR